MLRGATVVPAMASMSGALAVKGRPCQPDVVQVSDVSRAEKGDAEGVNLERSKDWVDRDRFERRRSCRSSRG
jgi:hypothetical protein